jgi:hypothetical protein
MAGKTHYYYRDATKALVRISTVRSVSIMHKAGGVALPSDNALLQCVWPRESFDGSLWVPYGRASVCQLCSAISYCCLFLCACHKCGLSLP